MNDAVYNDIVMIRLVRCRCIVGRLRFTECDGQRCRGGRQVDDEEGGQRREKKRVIETTAC